MTTEEHAEALHARYNCCGIVRLSSGNYAVFNPFSNDEGIDIVYIGPLTGAANAILSVEEVSARWEHSRTMEQSRRTTIAQIIGVAQPQVLNLPRRV